MRNNITAFKLCYTGNETRRTKTQSAVKHDSKCQTVFYQYGKLIRPNRTQNPFLFVFDSEVNAKNFAATRTSHNNYIIFEVKANNVRKVAKGKQYGANHTFYASLFPEGTQFCSSLRLVKKIWFRKNA